MLLKSYNFIKKYSFPFAIIQLFNIIVRTGSVAFYSTKLALILKFYGCKFGNNLSIDGKVYLKLDKKGQLIIGDNFILNSRFGSNLVGITNYAAFQCLEGGRIEIGNNCGFTSPILSCRKSIKFGNNVKLGGNVRIFDHDYHSLNYLHRRDVRSDSEHCKSESVYIGDDVFIGTNSIILKGVRIGERSLIGAGSIVTLKNIPPDSFVAGNPAKIINIQEKFE
jgi:acetyltransferase-like isoleucine patch superfamily enzyme